MQEVGPTIQLSNMVEIFCCGIAGEYSRLMDWPQHSSPPQTGFVSHWMRLSVPWEEGTQIINTVLYWEYCRTICFNSIKIKIKICNLVDWKFLTFVWLFKLFLRGLWPFLFFAASAPTSAASAASADATADAAATVTVT